MYVENRSKNKSVAFYFCSVYKESRGVAKLLQSTVLVTVYSDVKMLSVLSVDCVKS